MAARVETDEGSETNKGSMWVLDQKFDQPMDEEAGWLRTMYREKKFSSLLLLRLAFQSLGVVYGDLGTSPLNVFYNTFPHGINDPDVATSFVAEDISRNSSKESTSDSSCPNVSCDGSDESTGRKLLPSVSTALVLALSIGILEALAMYFRSRLVLDMMGISSGMTIFKKSFSGQDSSMRIPAQKFLSLKAIGAPAVVVSLAIQGIFREFKDTRTPVLCLGKL